MFAKDFRALAKNKLSGNWVTAIVTTLVAAVFGVFGFGMYTGGNYRVDYDDVPVFMFGVENYVDQMLRTPFGKAVFGAVAGLGGLVAVWSVVRFLMGGCIELGYRRYMLKLIDGYKAEFSDLFSMVKSMFVKGFFLQLLLDIYVILWCLVFVVPGIIKAYSYSMSSFILAEHPQLTASQAIKASKELMRGNKWRLFCLEMSFFGWYILCALSCGILALWVNPYLQAAKTEFYRRICFEKYGSGNVNGAAY